MLPVVAMKDGTINALDNIKAMISRWDDLSAICVISLETTYADFFLKWLKWQEG